MKKILAAALLLIAACSKPKNELTRLNESIQGAWVLQSAKMEYYGNTGKDFEEEYTGPGSFKEITFLQNLKTQLLIPGDQLLTTDYDIFKREEDNTTYLELYHVAVYNTSILQILSASSTAMTWKVRYNNIEYENTETGEITVAPYAILTLQLIRK